MSTTADLAMVLTTAYGLVGAMGVVAYLPQLRKLLKDTGRSENVPLSTWLMWGIQTLVVSAYAILVNGDPAMILVNVFSALACNACLGALLYNRYWKPLDSAGQAAAYPANVVPLNAVQNAA